MKDVERIFLTFGKMSSPVEFRSKPYEDCISGIVVDHSPRYHIDMEIQEKGKQTLMDRWRVCFLKQDRIRQWIELCIPYASQLQALDESLADQVFEAIFYPNH